MATPLPRISFADKKFLMKYQIFKKKNFFEQ